MTQVDYRSMSAPMRIVLWFVILNAYAGAASLMLFPSDTRQTFFWMVAPSVNAGMFGALYLCAGSLVLYAVVRGEWEPARCLTVMVPAFTGLMLLSTLLHWNAFNAGFERYYWLLVYCVAPVAGILFYVQHERKGATWRVVRQPITRSARVVAVGVGAGAAVVVVLMYAFPGLVAAVWPWTMSPLMVRVFASWLSAFAVGLLWFGVERDWTRLRPIAVLLVATATLLLLMLAVHSDDVQLDSLGGWFFGAGVAGVGLLGSYLLVSQTSGSAPRWRAALGKHVR